MLHPAIPEATAPVLAPVQTKSWGTKRTHPQYSIYQCPNCGWPESEGGYCEDCGWTLPINIGRVT